MISEHERDLPCPESTHFILRWRRTPKAGPFDNGVGLNAIKAVALV